MSLIHLHKININNVYLIFNSKDTDCQKIVYVSMCKNSQLQQYSIDFWTELNSNDH